MRLDLIDRNLTVVSEILEDLEKCASPNRLTELEVGQLEGVLDQLVEVRASMQEFGEYLMRTDGDALEVENVHALVVSTTTATRSISALVKAERTNRSSRVTEMVESAVLFQVDELKGGVTHVRQLLNDGASNDAWKEYRKLSEASRNFFAEYVDLVRGVTLRDRGFDEDLCTIADELMSSLGRFGTFTWKSLTIPASRERGRLTTSHLIHLGFPEWTVWTLPLAVHDLGHVFIENRKGMNTFVDSQTTLPPRVCSQWAADAFAAAVVGPAYAWAALVTRIDPPVDDYTTTDEWTDERAAVIFETLRSIDDAELRDDVDEIHDHWDTAVAAAGARPRPLVRARADFVTRLVETVRSQIPVGYRDHEIARRYADRLNDRTLLADEVPLMSTGSLPHVLNGAWIALRTRPGDAMLINEKTKALCLAYVNNPDARRGSAVLDHLAADHGSKPEPHRRANDHA